MRKSSLAAATSLLSLLASAPAQTVVQFTFDNAPVYSPLPIDVMAGGITAHLSATGQGYSIQSTSTAPIVPAGFSGRFVYPSSVFPADLLIGFSQTVTAFSILYSPDELGCDDSARMRVTAYQGAALVGTNTVTAANPGTYPVETLRCTFPQGFNRVVVHYDAPPPTCRDYGPIFLADDMTVTVGPVHVAGSCTPYGVGCAGSNGVLQQSASGTPEVGFAPVFQLGNGPRSSVALLVLGFTNTTWNGIPLPLDLTPIGYPGCAIYTELLATVTQATSSTGAASIPLAIPADPTLIGNHFYTQYWGVDAGALRFSNGVDTLVGGTR